MKIRQKLLLLLLLPLVCQLSLALLLANSYTKLEYQINAELHAKKIIAETVRIRSLMEQAVISIAYHSISGQGGASVEKFRLRLNKYFKELEPLAKNETVKNRLMFKKMTKDMNLMLDLWEELAASYKPHKSGRLYFSRFYSRGELAEAITVAFNQVSDDCAMVMEKFVPISQEFRPDAVKAREGMRNAVSMVILFNIILVAGFAYLLNRTTLSRLLVLSKNMEQFAHGKPASEKLSGNDELNGLDNAFQEMSSKLIELEKHRKSMRAMVSHDLRSPLTSMILKTKIMLSDEKRNFPPVILRDLKSLHSEADRLRRLANTLLDIEKMEDGSIEVDLESIPFPEILELSTDSITTLCKRKKISLETEYPEDCFLLCDKDRSIQVLINFLSNAVKFAPKNSKLVIKVLPSENNWRIEVHDQGPGVPEDKQNKLFAKFIQLEQAEETRKEGSGLGLYICKLLIEAQKGEVGYKASELGGSCFWFQLSRSQKPDI